MKLIKSRASIFCARDVPIFKNLIMMLCLLIFLVGCGDQVHLPSASELLEFNHAGPVCPSLDIEQLTKAKIKSGPYRIVPGDVLELTMPAIVRFVSAEEAGSLDTIVPYLSRVHESGTMALPIVGEIKVAGKTLSQIELSVIDAYYPEYVVTRPSVFARVLEYQTGKVSISGAVDRPGIYSLRSDQMSLIALLMEAGGIVDEGAAVIRIVHRNPVVPDDARSSPSDIDEAPAEIDGIRGNKLANKNFADNNIDVQLAFRESATLRTVGQLTLRHGHTIIFSESLNISSQSQRLRLLKRLGREEPRLSTVDLNEKLKMLAKKLDDNQGLYADESESQNSPIQFALGSGSHHRKRIDRTGFISPQKWTVSDFESEQDIWQPVHPQPYHHPLPDRVIAGADGNTFQNRGIFTNHNVQRDIDELFDQKAVAILDRDRGPRSERIAESGETQDSEAFVLPIKGLNIPFTDVVLQDGDRVIVERLQLPLFSVVGLVNNPGNFPYPPDTQYNLMQALAFAGGLDRSTEPRYATIYRLKPDQTIVSAVFEVINIKNGSQLTKALNTQIKAGDVIAVEHTPRTRTKLFLDTVFRINIGTYWRMNDAWEE